MELEDILVTSPLPLHPSLAHSRRLSVRVAVDGQIYGKTPFVSGDPETGIWKMNRSLKMHKVPKSGKDFSLTIVADTKGSKKKSILAEFEASELLTRVDARSDSRYHEISTCHPSSLIQFTISYSIKVSSSPIYNTSGSTTTGRSPVEISTDKLKSEESSVAEATQTLSRIDLENYYAIVSQQEARKTRARALNLAGYGFYQLYQDNHEFEDLERAISIHEEAMQHTLSSDSRFAEHSSDLGRVLRMRFDVKGNKVDIDRAMALCQDAVNVTIDTDKAIIKWLVSLGNCKTSRFDRFGEIQDINEAVSIWKQTVKLMEDSDPNMHVVLGNLGPSLQKQCKRSGRLDDLVWAISFFESAVERMPDGHAGKPNLLSNLGSFVGLSFEHFGDVKDLERSMSFQQAALDLTPDDHSQKPTRLTNLGNSFGLRFKRLGDVKDLERSISLFQIAVDLMPESHLDKPALLHNLGASFQARFGRLADIDDLEKSISFAQAAVDLTPDNHPDKSSRLNNLGNSVQLRFERFGDVVDLERSISLRQVAVDLMPDGHPDKPARLNDLGISVGLRFERLGNIEDLKKSISFHQAAVDLTPDSHPDKPTRISNLGISIELRFERVGDVEDLERAISYQQAAVNLTPDGHPDKPARVSNLGSTIQSRFDRFKDVRDLERSISFKQAAVDLMPDGHRDKPSLLNNLGNSVQLIFERLGNVQDLEKAISFKQAAVDLTPDGHPDKPGWLNNLANSVESRFERLGDFNDLEKSISLFQRAVDLMPEGHPSKPGLLNNLGRCFQLRFERLEDNEDLERSISFKQAAVDLTPDGHPGKPAYLNSLGVAFLDKLQRSPNSNDLQRAIALFSTAATSPVGPSIVRFQAAAGWARLSHLGGQNPLIAFECAINLLPQVAWLGIPLTNQHAQLTKAGDVVRHAVAVAIELQEYETAIQWAEYGRSIVWQNLVSLRSPLDELNKAYPELAMRLERISRQLEGSLSRHSNYKEEGPLPLQDVANKASTLASERDKIIEQVRRLPGFEYFLKAKAFDKLTPVAYEGPVAIINVHELRSDALILIPHDSQDPNVSIVNIPLESFSYDMSEKLFRRFSQLLSSEGVRARDSRQAGRRLPKKKMKGSLGSILADLWVHVVKHVIDGLAYQPGDNSRIWWCATGPLAFLPIHAAGIYDSDVVWEKLSEYVVSSYTPTLTAILDQSLPPMIEKFQILTVALPSTPNAPPLPSTESEVRQVKGIAGDICVQNLTSAEATTVRVMQGMKESNWIHLACHGIQDNKESMRSGFLLHDKTLELSEIIREPLPKADFAFLSACQTAKGDENVAEESVHLAAGMLFSGCKGVIGTMWSIQDNDAPKVAKAVYEWMLKDGTPNRKEAARALHEAVRELRESGADFLSWVPFIHMGR
ncbi:hypothetical protein M408DRAFT_23647 [Serendipita vermifera MAFF 305830]|uniref:CHAT domain-containing protein n=1 Tax=Serendipita vermifera MAFF 305830 TaxID=933852 RepID=A0A0C3BB08_SERVB|nr:hypothetical protein M408DRAFT_23647 [Serendipita vermifera MAFF 305830]